VKIFVTGVMLLLLSSAAAHANITIGHYINPHPPSDEASDTLDVSADPNFLGARDVVKSFVLTIAGCTGSGAYKIYFGLTPTYGGTPVKAWKRSGIGVFNCGGFTINMGIGPVTASFRQPNPQTVVVNSSLDANQTYVESTSGPGFVTSNNLEAAKGSVSATITKNGVSHSYVGSIANLLKRLASLR
jgi:hypothetical protein